MLMPRRICMLKHAALFPTPQINLLSQRSHTGDNSAQPKRPPEASEGTAEAWVALSAVYSAVQLVATQAAARPDYVEWLRCRPAKNVKMVGTCKQPSCMLFPNFPRVSRFWHV